MSLSHLTCNKNHLHKLDQICSIKWDNHTKSHTSQTLPEDICITSYKECNPLRIKSRQQRTKGLTKADNSHPTLTNRMWPNHPNKETVHTWAHRRPMTRKEKEEKKPRMPHWMRNRTCTISVYSGPPTQLILIPYCDMKLQQIEVD